MILPSAPITWVANQIITAAQMNANIRDVANMVLFGPAAEGFVSGAQNVAGSAWDEINLDGNSLNTDAMWAAGTPSRFTIKTAGVYLISGQVTFAANATGRRLAGIGANGANANLIQTETVAGPTNATSVQLPARRVSLDVGDYIELQSFQSSGGVLALVVGNANTFLSAQWVGHL